MKKHLSLARTVFPSKAGRRYENPYGVSPQRSPHGPKYPSDVRDSSEKRLSAMERLKPNYPPPNGNVDMRGYHPEGSSGGSLDRGKYGGSEERGRKKGYPVPPPGENAYFAYRVEQPPYSPPADMEKRVVEGKVRQAVVI